MSGGHCLPVDPSYLAWRVRQTLGQPFRFIELANEVNDHMPDYVVSWLAAIFNSRGLAVRDRTVLLMGFAAALVLDCCHRLSGGNVEFL